MPANDIYTVLERLGYWHRASASPTAAGSAAVQSQRELLKPSRLIAPGDG